MIKIEHRAVLAMTGDIVLDAEILRGFFAQVRRETIEACARKATNAYWDWAQNHGRVGVASLISSAIRSMPDEEAT